MNDEKEGKLDPSDIPIIDLTMDDSDDSKELIQSHNAEITKGVFAKKTKEDSPASQGFSAESRLPTCHQEIAASSTKSKTVSKRTKEGDLSTSKVVRRVGEIFKIGSQKKMAKKDQELRRSVSKAVLSETLWNRCKETVDLKMDKAATRNIAILVEESLFLVSGGVKNGYMDKYKNIVEILKDTKKKLFRQVATQKITPNDLVNMTSEELADVDMAAWQETKLPLMLNAERKGKLSLKNISEADGTKTDERLKAVKKADTEFNEGAKALPIATVPSFPLDSNQETIPVHRANSDATLLTVDLTKNQSENYRNQETKSSYYAENKNTFNKPRYHHSSASKGKHQKHAERVGIMKKPDSNDQSTSLLSACEEVSKSVPDNWMMGKVNALRVTDHVAHSVADSRRVEAISVGGNPLEKQFCMKKLDFDGPALLLKNQVPIQTADAEKNSKICWSAEAAFREAMIPYLGPPSRLNHSSLDIKPHTPVVGVSPSYPRLIRITGITDRTRPADPRLRARSPSFERKPSNVTVNIPLLNEDSSSINTQTD